ncbi:hypothetical protein LEM8419_02700 [Neolewinella maritima]|uniref:DUF2851 family protein n=1 Tax=Neolewinella maritima TaxID=1383882 RepID=A0ABN8F4D4_9BACT|nr:DUF2851 family protein [Neolewinella maritima]CAH1001793.1 hypothetical protein LEM8419_02700 [Neolewinella maritima]
MREDFLHYLWRLARFDLRQLRTTEGEALTIQQFGTHNTDAGPDFGAARLRIGGLQWAGKVEMHLRSSEWYTHGHETDPAYDGVILHVVLEEDTIVYRRDGSRIPCLELRDRIPAGIRTTYWRLMHQSDWVPCQSQLDTVADPLRAIWLQRMLVERLGRRATDFAQRLEATQRDWEEAFYHGVARAMGGKVNAQAMEMLARSVPLRVLLRHKHSLLQLEALLFGQSGLLPKREAGEDPYHTRLRQEYELLRVKHELRPLPATAWRFLRMRPNNFPTLRIAQLACLYHRSGQLFGKALAAADVGELRQMFVVSLSNYWRTHYRFGAEAETSERRLGASTVRSILINAVAPAYFTYGGLRNDDRYRDRALEVLEALPPESNAVITKWRALGWSATSAGESQALLEMKHTYCDQRRCTSCAVGCAILNRPDAGQQLRTEVREPVRIYRSVG